jgi:lipopolysaccharide/colanic/teichoic acid biosynthesis glycosyltransferase
MTAVPSPHLSSPPHAGGHPPRRDKQPRPVSSRRAAGVSAVDRRSDAACRLLNVLVALAALLVTAPIMLVIAVLVRITSPGPVLYVQTRIGRDRRDPASALGNSRRVVHWGGRPFTIYKFRTMYCGLGSADDQVWARPGDPRVTPIGRLLRKYRLDELPQLLNVVVGDMNLVGPRPEQPGIVMRLRSQVENYDRRNLVPPGITGWAQIEHHYDRSIEDVRRKVQYDLEYIARRSAFEDLRIMMRTVPVVLLRKGAW